MEFVVSVITLFLRIGEAHNIKEIPNRKAQSGIIIFYL